MFMSMEKRDEYYKSKAYIHTKRVSAKTLGITCETYLQGIFIDECLAKETRVLFKQCREKLECLGYKCYTEHQQIYVKKPQLARRKIFSYADLCTLVDQLSATGNHHP